MNTKGPSEFRKFLISAARRDLDAARAHPVWNEPSLVASDDPGQKALALSAAEALGRLLLLGQVPKEDDVLPTHILRLAIAALADRLAKACEQARELGTRWDRESDFETRDELCLNALEERTDIHAAYVGLLESVERRQDEAFDEELERLEDELRQYDTTLAEHEELLASVASNPLVQNLRGALAEEGQPAPWWLSEDLEELAQRAIEENDKLLAHFQQNAATVSAATVQAPTIASPIELFQAIAAGAKSQPQDLYLVWQSPNQRIRAISRVPAQWVVLRSDSNSQWVVFPSDSNSHSLSLSPMSIAATLRVVFRSDSPEALQRLRGAPVWLANVEGRIGPDDVAEFPTERVWESLKRGGRATLAVGSPEALWPVEPEAPEQAKAMLDEEG